jgi:glycosyltransferase involved in cell wall biosynthesis
MSGTRHEPAGHVARGGAGYESRRAVQDLEDEHAGAVDVLIVSLGSTGGLRRADEELAGSLRRAGASVAVAASVPPRRMRTFALTDLGWALAARRAARAELARRAPRAVIYSSTTAALLWPRPGAIRFDAPSVGNRPGRHGLWQRPLERRRLRQAPLLLPWSRGALHEASAAADRGDRALVLPVAVEPSAAREHAQGEGSASGSDAAARDIAAVTYGANPTKKGLDRVLAAWRAVRRPGEELLVMGADADGLRRAGLASLASTLASSRWPADAVNAEGPPVSAGVRAIGMLPYEEYRALLRRARVFVCAPRREDYGIAQLEALADGCELVTTPAPGPYAALPVARELDGRLVGDDLPSALRTALDDPSPGYSARALDALAPFRREAVDRTVAERLLPRLLA